MSTNRIIVEGFVNKQIFPRTKVKSGDFAIFTFSPESVIGEIDKRTKNQKYKTDAKKGAVNPAAPFVVIIILSLFCGSDP